MSTEDADGRVRLGTFELDVTPAVGDPIAYGTADAIDDPLLCRGVVLLADGAPVVLAAVDWIGNYNGGHDAWRMALAEAVGTSPERVAVHCVHQHEAPGFDRDADLIMLGHGEPDQRIDSAFAADVLSRAGDAAREAAAAATPITHVGLGEAEVEDVASNRQLLGPDGQIAHVRFSSEADPEWRAAHEGLVDPTLSMISFWNEEEPVAALSYYATHPQSHYGDRRVTRDFPGLAREIHVEETGVPLVHFCGAAGNVAAGKYNDGSPEMRPELARRVADGMAAAWEATERTPISPADVGWRVRRAALPPADRLAADELTARVREDRDQVDARTLAWLHRCEVGQTIPIPCLDVGDASVLHMPGELFVEYQLAAKRMRPDRFVAMTAYGDGGPGYIGTRAAYPKGGYEVGDPSNVSPEVEDVLTGAMRELLSATDSDVTPSDLTGEKPLLGE